MTPQCDNKAVGVLIFDKDDRMLLLKRGRYPMGYAPVAGHIDDHGVP